MQALLTKKVCTVRSMLLLLVGHSDFTDPVERHAWKTESIILYFKLIWYFPLGIIFSISHCICSKLNTFYCVVQSLIETRLSISYGGMHL